MHDEDKQHNKDSVFVSNFWAKKYIHTMSSILHDYAVIFTQLLLVLLMIGW